MEYFLKKIRFILLFACLHVCMQVCVHVCVCLYVCGACKRMLLVCRLPEASRQLVVCSPSQPEGSAGIEAWVSFKSTVSS